MHIDTPLWVVVVASTRSVVGLLVVSTVGSRVIGDLSNGVKWGALVSHARTITGQGCPPGSSEEEAERIATSGGRTGRGARRSRVQPNRA
eukprot:scaffold624_cov402-Prasinococcus_capsulatus_cf.AAC.60